jgi:outer membrane immunogenic protein
MKKVVLAGASLLAMSMAAPASAADLAAKPYVKAPPAPVVAVYDWTGFYIGGNGGWGQARACWDLLEPTGFVDTLGCRDASGGLVGGQLGYRWQTGAWVWGVEGQGDWANLRATRVSLFDPAFSTRAKVDGIGLITGQIGYAWNAALLYFKGGAAVASNRFEILDTATGTSLASASSTRWGGAVGVGFEYGFTPNWSVGLEYDHLFMGHNNNSFSIVNPIVAGALNRISEDVDMVTIRFNYRFGGYGAPIAARY